MISWALDAWRLLYELTDPLILNGPWNFCA
jgi:hypothetical protein